MLWSVRPEIGWADEYRFDLPNDALWAGMGSRGEFCYSIETGEFTDSDAWQRSVLSEGGGFEILSLAQLRVESLAPSSDIAEREEVIRLFQSALKRGLAEYPWQAARAWRAIGEINELSSNLIGAISAYEQALSADPKVGVKRRMNSLKKAGS